MGTRWIARQGVFALALGLAFLGAGMQPTQAGEEGAAPAPKRPVPSEAVIERLVKDLGSPDYATRERAFHDLFNIGEPARNALQRAMRESDNMEARWRAEQIIRRLDREGEQPLGGVGDDETPPPPPVPAPEAGKGRASPQDRFDALERQMEALRRMMGLAGDPFGRFGIEEPPQRLEAGGLVLEVTAFGFVPRVTLRVPADPKAKTPAATLEDRTLEGVLRRRPDLADHPGMDGLKKKWDAFKRSHPTLFPFERIPFDHFPFGGRGGRSGITVQSFGQGIEITQNGDRVHVKVTERGPDGKENVREYDGESLEQLKRDYP
ncbi:MAG: hypothetical protein ACC662_05240, partial [Planctomycetota bacterium]